LFCGVYEDRFGGCALGEKKRGGDEIYGESIYTKRAELMEVTNCRFRKN
jgi:outer membrane receptor for ferrienterochelin and colicins